MNNIESALFTFLPDLSISDEHSRSAEIFFGTTDFRSASIASLLCLDAERERKFAQWVGFAFESALSHKHWHKIARICPVKEIRRVVGDAERFFTVDFQPIFDQGRMTRLMVMASDITAQKKAEQYYEKSQREKELQLERVQAFVENRVDVMVAFIEDAEALMKGLSEVTPLQLRDAVETRKALHRATHTLKGNSGSMGLTELPRLLQKTEDLFETLSTAHDPAELDSAWKAVCAELLVEVETITSLRRKLFLTQENRIPVDAHEFDTLLGQLSQDAVLTTPQEIGEALDELISVTLETFCQKYNNLIQSYCTRFGKNVGPVRIAPGSARIPPRLALLLDRPVMHLVRNCIDHGIEPADERSGQGKPATGTVSMACARSANTLTLTIEDDGRGIDPELIAREAVRKGFITLPHAETMTAQQKLELIMLYGFSTKSTVSEISGRGVGMDAVSKALDKAHGTLEIRSQLGTGTRFTIRLPMDAVDS
jgi:signal transduction histidine kinase